MKKALALAALAAVVLTAAATAGVSAIGGTVTADGSSTVGPYAIAAAEGFQKKNPKARVTVGDLRHGRRFRALLPERDRPRERVPRDEGVGSRDLP